MNVSVVAISSFIWRSIGISGQRLLSFLVLIILARVLSTSEFGTASTATMLVLLLYPITRFGVYDYLIQKELVDTKIKTTALLVSMGLGISLFLVVSVTATRVASLFSDPELAAPIRVLSLIFLIAPISTVQEAILAKQFKFRYISTCQILAFIPSGCVGILLALRGHGALSVVVQQVLLSFLTSLFLWIVEPWRPKIKGVCKEIPSMMRLGAGYTISQFLISLNTNLFGLGVAFVSGTEAAGIFRVAWSGLMFCIQMVIQPASNVMQPLFSERRNDPERLKASYLKVARYFATLTFPVFTFVGVMATELITFGFGSRWQEAGPALAIMCLFVFAGAPNYLARSFLGAIGRPDQAIVLGLFETAISVTAIVVFAPWGINGIAAAVVLRTWVLLPISLRMIRKMAGVTLAGMVDRYNAIITRSDRPRDMLVRFQTGG